MFSDYKYSYTSKWNNDLEYKNIGASSLIIYFHNTYNHNVSNLNKKKIDPM